MLNKVILIGRLGKDPEVRTFEGTRKVANFSLATSEVYKDKNGQRQESTEWHNIAIWGPQAEIAEKYLKKGMLLYVEGSIKTRSYEKDGVKKFVTDIQADTFKMLERKEDGARSSNDNGDNSYVPASGAEDDLPF